MNILIHTRNHDVFESIKATLEGQHHHVDGAFSVNEGHAKMVRESYGKVFIGIGVPSHERLALIAQAGALGMSIIEIVDANTVTKEMLMHSPSGTHPIKAIPVHAWVEDQSPSPFTCNQ